MFRVFQPQHPFAADFAERDRAVTERAHFADYERDEDPRLTQNQANIVTAYTGILCGDIAEFHAYAERLLGRPIWTHEFADKEVWTVLKSASQEAFLGICRREEDIDGSDGS